LHASHSNAGIFLSSNDPRARRRTTERTNKTETNKKKPNRQFHHHLRRLGLGRRH